jgi:RHS repeat-associated protein
MSVNRTLLFVFLLAAASLVAQDVIPTKVDTQNRTGPLPFSSSVAGDVDAVDVATQSLRIHIPIFSLPGRGIPARLALRWDGQFWTRVHFIDIHGNLVHQWKIEQRQYMTGNGQLALGWQQTSPGYTTNGSVSFHCNVPSATAVTNTNYVFTDEDGAKHRLAVQGTASTACPISDLNGPALSGDGTFAKKASPTAAPVVYSAAGSRPDEDSNGNKYTPYVDTLGRTYAVVTGPSGQTVYTITDSNGTSRSYTVTYTSILLATKFEAPSPLVQEFSGGRSVISSIQLPNGQQYTFEYENSNVESYGGLTKVTLPTGGYIQYTWGTWSDANHTHRIITSRTVHVSGESDHTWLFSRTGSNVTVTDPLGHVSVYTIGAGDVVTVAKLYEGAAQGNPLRKYAVDYLYDSDPWVDPFFQDPEVDPEPYESQPAAARPIRITTTLEDGRVTKKEFDYDSLTYTYHTTHHDPGYLTATNFTTSRGNVTQVREYDYGAVPGTYGSGTPGPLVRKTTNTYLHDSNANYVTYNIVNRVLNSTIYDGAGAQKAQTQYEYDSTAITSTSNTAPQHDTAYSSTFIYRGNHTKVKRWRNTDGALLTTTYTYDDLGNVRSIQDPGLHTKTWSYADNWFGTCPTVASPAANSQALPTLVTNHLGQRIKLAYFPCTGATQSQKDENDIAAGRSGTTFTYDLLGRPATTSASDGGQTSNVYEDNLLTTTSTTKISSNMNMVSIALQDGLGRVKQTQLTSDPEGTVYTDTTYDALGRVSSVSNPYRSTSDPTYGMTTTSYDGLGRSTTVIAQDGSPTTTNYGSNCVTASDPANKKRKSCSDALGRLTQVFEDPSGVNYETDYQYDTLDNLIRVDQKGGSANSSDWRTRTFTYNSLSQLTQAINPESGTINYSYDDDSNLAIKDSPQPNQAGAARQYIDYCYDALHRLTKKYYRTAGTRDCNASSPPVTYAYDQPSAYGLTIANGVGRRTSMADQSGQTAWSLDPVGRSVIEQRTVNGTVAITKSTSYFYNLDGSLAGLTYPSGRTVTYTYTAAARLLSAVDVVNGVNYVSAATYSPWGVLTSDKYGVSGTFSGIVIANDYNKRLQPITLAASTPGPPSQTVISYTYDFHLNGPDNNGNVYGITNGLDGIRPNRPNGSEVFTYDSLNRITSSHTPGATPDCTVMQPSGLTKDWGQNFTVDNWGNLTAIATERCSTPTLSATANANNRLVLTGLSYDAAGNLTSDGSHSFFFDAEHRICSIGGTSCTTGTVYDYDGDGKRIKKSTGTLYWTGVGSSALTESDSSGNLSSDYIFFGADRIARFDFSTSTTHFYFSDHLGSHSVVTNTVGALEQESDFYPYGGERPITNGTNHYRFTGKERDSETGLDNFGARYYTSNLGRFTTRDRIGVTLLRILDPQRLNAYSYVRNSPLQAVDPDGNDIQPIPGQSPQDLRQLVKDLAQAYKKESFRKKFDALEKSPKIHQEGRGDVPQRPPPVITPASTEVAVPKSGKVDRETTGWTRTTYDRKLMDEKSPSERVSVEGHELFHVELADKDPQQSINNHYDPKGGLQEEHKAEAFGNQILAEPDTLTDEQAEKAVQDALGLTNDQFNGTSDHKEKNPK